MFTNDDPDVTAAARMELIIREPTIIVSYCIHFALHAFLQQPVQTTGSSVLAALSDLYRQV